jgi:hypothetical protein
VRRCGTGTRSPSALWLDTRVLSIREPRVPLKRAFS